MFLAYTNAGRAQENEKVPDTIQKSADIDTTYLDQVINYRKSFSFIDYAVNFIEWYDSSAILPFFNKLKKSETQKVKILHIGDSHIQVDYYPGFVRNKLQDIFGAGGRGFVFPYKSAGTHATYDYSTQSYGKWDFARNVLLNTALDIGITGATIRTTDSTAGFSIIFKSQYKSIQADFKRIRLFFKRDTASFNMFFSTSLSGKTTFLNTHRTGGRTYLEFDLPQATDSLFFFVKKSDVTQTFFECYGVLIESTTDNGILYSSVGINGAGYRAVLQQNLMEEQLRDYQPDLVILDLGENDYYRGKFDAPLMEGRLAQIITIIRHASPQCCILLTNSQDNYYKRLNIRENEDFSDFTRKMAIKYRCAQYDFYHVCGGRYSMLDWSKAGLAQKDKIHLNWAGYALKGELLVNAILNSYREFLANGVRNTMVVGKFIASNAEIPSNFDDIIAENKQWDTLSVGKDTAVRTVSPQKQFHVVRRGESLAGIANQYNLSTNDLMFWNQLKSNKLYTGQKLALKEGSKTKRPPTSNYGYATADASPWKEKKSYKIKQGDNLGTIAEKFNIRVSDIKRWNHLKNSRITAGKTLILYVPLSKNKGSAGKDKKAVQKAITPDKTQAPVLHTVIKGETLWSIARKYNVSIEDIKNRNKLNKDNLQPGKILKIR